jgi:hypothetical protein
MILRDNDRYPSPDAALEQRLDEALAPPPAPAGLSDRIVLRTAGLLQRYRSGVLARIDQFYRWPRALAAAVVLAAGLGILVSATQIVRSAQTLVAVGRGLDALPAYRPGPDLAPDSGPSLAIESVLRQDRRALRDAQADLERGLLDIEQGAPGEHHG